tara:strand:+ start:126 stop:1982 length:1857 start_codon:yes stop_codon:yes gene_type:complete
MKEFLKSFGAALATSVAPGLYGSNSSASLGRMLKDGTKEDFNNYLGARQAAVKGEYDAYKTKFDAFESQAKTLTDLIGDNTIDAETDLTSQEAAARLMKGKTSADVGELITKFKSLRDQDGVNIRDLLGDSLKRGDEEARRNYTTADIARMQVGGGFKYTPKPFDLRERRSGLGNFLRDQGLFTKTFETEREGVAKKQAEMITAGFNAKYTGDTPYQEAQGFITVDAAKLRTQEQQRATEVSILNLDNAKDARKYAQAQEVRSQRLFNYNMSNNVLKQQVSEGQLSDQEYNRKTREVEAALSGRAQNIALVDALNVDAKNPTEETANAVRAAQENVAQHSLTLNFYEKTQTEVDRLKKQDPRFESTQRAGLVKDSAGNPLASGKVIAYKPDEAATVEQQLWEKVYMRSYSMLDKRNRLRINENAFLRNLSPEYQQDVRLYHSVMDAGVEAAGKDATAQEKVIAGVKALYPNADEEKHKAIFDSVFATDKRTGVGALMKRQTSDNTKQPETETPKQKAERISKNKEAAREDSGGLGGAGKSIEAKKAEILEAEKRFINAQSTIKRYNTRITKQQEANKSGFGAIKLPISGDELRKARREQIAASDILKELDPGNSLFNK